MAELADALDTELDRIDSRSLLLPDMELPLTFVLADLEAAGIAVDTKHFHELEQQFADRCVRPPTPLTR